MRDGSPSDSENCKNVNLLLKSVNKGHNSRAQICTIVKIGQAIGVPIKYDHNTRRRETTF